MPGPDLHLIRGDLPGAFGGFTTRAGGVSPPPWDWLNLGLHVGDETVHALANRARLADAVGATRLVFPEQVHGAKVAVVEGDEQTDAAGADALVTAEPGVAVGVLVADCVPVLLADGRHGVVGAAHSGRRGLVAGVLQATLAGMAALGAEPGSISAVIGPSICGRCYEVPEAMREEVSALVPGTATRTRHGTPALDLACGAGEILRAAGVADVALTGICTAEDERFYSFRRDRVTGRFAGVVMLGPRD